MAYRKLTGIDDKILRAIWQLGAEVGVKKVTARKVGALCGVSDYTVFCHFGNSNRGFLDAAALHFFSLYIDPFLSRIEQFSSVGDIWDAAIDLLLTEPNGMLYFRQYCAAFGLTEELFAAEKRIRAAKALTVASPPVNEHERSILLDFFFSTAFHYAEHLARGTVQDTAEARTFLRALIRRAFGEA